MTQDHYDDMTVDPGITALHTIFHRLSIDECWTVRRERGFSWIGSNLVQHIDASPVFDSFGCAVSDVVIRTRLVDLVTGPESRIQKFLAHKNGFAVGSALLYSASETAVDLVLAHTVHAQTVACRSEELANFGILQLIEAERDAGTLASICNGRVARAAHPENGPRPEPDEMLGVGMKIFVPAGEGQSRFAGVVEMRLVYEWLDNSRFASFGASHAGISIEVPFGASDTSLIELRSDVPHPSLGAGLAVRTTIRLNESPDSAIALATRLQKAQLAATGAGGQMGAWGVRPDLDLPHVAWSRFVPNALYRPGITLDVAICEVSRALWVDRTLHPGLPERNPWEIIEARNKLRSDAARPGQVS